MIGVSDGVFTKHACSKMMNIVLMILAFPAMDRFLAMGNNITEILQTFNITDIHQIQDIF